jgi:DNA topoisomerase-1
MKEARREGKGKDAKLIMADGSEPPAHIKPTMVSEKWHNVKVSTDPKAELLVEGKNNNGKTTQVTSKDYHARRDVAKGNKMDEFLANDEKIEKQIHAARKDPKRKEEADVSFLMREQATRVGSEEDTKARKQAYGATTLQARHVVQAKDGVRLQFAGKEGISHNHLVQNQELAKMLMDRKQTAKDRKEPIFNTNDAKVRDFMATTDGGSFTPKDLRSGWATRNAIKEVQADPRPSKNMKEHKARILAVATKISKTLGNEPEQARDTYIDPRVFHPWRPPA